MEIKNFSEDILIEVAKLCRQSMELDIMPDFLLREKTFGEPDFDPGMTLAVYPDNSNIPAGFIQGVIKDRHEEKIGYIKLFCVNPGFRRKGIASLLYENIETQMKKRGIKKIRVYESYPNYFMPGVDPFYTEAICFFERNGFKKFSDTSNLTADLFETDFDTHEDEKKLEPENIFCRRAETKDKVKINEWIKKNFNAWLGEVSESFNNNPVSLFIAEKNGEIGAFSAFEVNNKGTGWFGPMGTDDSLRGKGIGGILFKKCLADMKDIGYSKAIIPWVGPIPFYMKYANARVSRLFWRYEKKLE